MTDATGQVDWLRFDMERECERICDTIRDTVLRHRRKGAVVALSGGIDSSVVAALSVRALGPKRVFGLHMPERDSASETLGLSQSVSDALGIDSKVEAIGEVLEAAGCYRRRDDAIRLDVPDYGPEHRSKIVLPSLAEGEQMRLFSLVVQAPDGTLSTYRLSLQAYLGIVAATNFKQRVRKMMEYYHADRLNYVVMGTPNRLEYDQGFFVKLGDGAADIKPIAHLYKTQVYAMAEYLGVPEQVRRRPSTTDTYSLPQSQEEFYFSLPYPQMDLCLYGMNHGLPEDEVAAAAGLSLDEVRRSYLDIEQKRRTTDYLHAAPTLIERIDLS